MKETVYKKCRGMIWAFALVIVLAFALATYLWQMNAALIAELDGMRDMHERAVLAVDVGHLGSAHRHVDIAMYVNGQKINFSEKQYQLRSSYIHFEEGDGDVLHVHATGLTLKHLFNTLDIQATRSCIGLGKDTPDEKLLCSNEKAALHYIVNGKPSTIAPYGVFKEGDKILVAYGSYSEKELQEMYSTVTDKAKGLAGKPME